MLETSKDLLWIVLSFCILWFTIFVCWAIYYVIAMLKNVNDLVRDIKEKIGTVESFFTSLKDKIEKSSSSINALVNVGNQVAQYVKSRTEDKKPKKSKSK